MPIPKSAQIYARILAGYLIPEGRVEDSENGQFLSRRWF